MHSNVTTQQVHLQMVERMDICEDETTDNTKHPKAF